ncbi:efflux RND transporter periplasmic adaptor subunit [Candidatus Kapaibacterium sp.]
MNRKLIISLAGFVIIIALSFVMFKMMTAKKAKEPSLVKMDAVKYVKVIAASYSDNKFRITPSGRLNSKNSAEIFSEVQGTLDLNTNRFKVGNSFRKGEILMSLDNEEFRFQLNAQKSEFLNLMAVALPDIKLEFPGAYNKWVKFTENIDINKPLPELPGYEQGKEKFFLAARKVLSQYYAIKNLEVRLSKYIIRAPFDGVVTMSMIEPGTLVRVGQKLGEIAGTGVFELEISLSPADADLISPGAQIKVLGDNKEYNGSLIRKSSTLDPATQTVKIYIQVSGSELSDGMYMLAEISGKNIPASFVLPRKALVNNSFVYVDNNGKLERRDIKVLALSENEAYISGPQIGEKVIIDALVNPVLGMKVQSYN